MYKIIGADGNQYGPVSIDQLRDWAAQGRVNAQTRVQLAGSNEWKAAADVPELASILAAPLARQAGAGAPPILTPPRRPVQERGLAVASLVLGLCSYVLCLTALSGIPAIICGHIARRRAARSPTQYGGSGLAMAGLVLGYASIVLFLVVAAIVMPELAKAKRRIQPTGCENNLRQVGLAFRVWALDHGDQFPFNVSTNSGGTLELCARGEDGFESNALAHFRIISNELSTPRFLVCPNDRQKHPASNFETLGQANLTYRLRTGTNVNAESPQEILAVCPIHGNELYCDGNVRKRGRVGQ